MNINKSLAFKNKLYLFLLLILSLFIFIYLFYFLINGERGIISYFKIKNQNISYKNTLEILNNKSIFFSERVSRLQTNTIDLDFLDEKIRQKIGYLNNNEIVITFD
jgi:cell division protein FtsB